MYHLSVSKHILIECLDFSHIFPNYFVAASRRELFEKVDTHNVINFIKEANHHPR